MIVNESLNTFSAIILASGKGTRMKSDKPKVLMEFEGKPMICRVIEACQLSGAERIIITLSNNIEQIRKAVDHYDVSIVYEEAAKGTGSSALAGLSKLDGGVAVVVNSDHPKIRPESIVAVVDRFKQKGYDAAPVSWEIEDAGGYGRIVRDANGQFEKIVEASECSDEQLMISEYNVGTYVFNADLATKYMVRITNDNSKGEYYITDVFDMMRRDGLSVGCIKGDESLSIGANTIEELKAASKSE